MFVRPFPRKASSYSHLTLKNVSFIRFMGSQDCFHPFGTPRNPLRTPGPHPQQAETGFVCNPAAGFAEHPLISAAGAKPTQASAGEGRRCLAVALSDWARVSEPFPFLAPSGVAIVWKPPENASSDPFWLLQFKCLPLGCFLPAKRGTRVLQAEMAHRI